MVRWRRPRLGVQTPRLGQATYVTSGRLVWARARAGGQATRLLSQRALSSVPELSNQQLCTQVLTPSVLLSSEQAISLLRALIFPCAMKVFPCGGHD